MQPAVAVDLDDDEPSGWFTPDTERRAWQEQELRLPPWPRDSRLVEPGFNTGSAGFRVLFDPDSVSVGDDDVVRYTVVLEAPTGVQNINYEGLHCADKTVRRMAYGADGDWHVLEDTPWERIRRGGIYGYRMQLFYNYMCNPDEPRASVRRIVDRLRYGVQSIPQ